MPPVTKKELRTFAENSAGEASAEAQVWATLYLAEVIKESARDILGMLRRLL